MKTLTVWTPEFLAKVVAQTDAGYRLLSARRWDAIAKKWVTR